MELAPRTESTVYSASCNKSDDGIDENEHLSTKKCRYLASVLWPKPLFYIAHNPKLILAWYLAVNTVFICVGKSVSFITQLITVPGFFLLIFLLLYWAASSLARSLVYPGYTATVSRSMEKDIASLVHKSIIDCIELCSSLISCVFAVRDSSNCSNYEMDTMANMIQNIIHCRAETLASVESSLEKYNPSENIVYATADEDRKRVLAALTKFNRVLDELTAQVFVHIVDAATKHSKDKVIQIASDLCAGATANVVNIETIDGSSSPVEVTNAQNPLLARFLKDAMHLRFVADLLIDTSDTRQSVKSGSDLESGVHEEAPEQYGLVDNSGSTGIANTIMKNIQGYQVARRPFNAVASIHFMRTNLMERFGARQVWVTSFDGTQLDTLYIPGRNSRFTDNRTMLLCNPNCGIYEYAGVQSQWLRFYHELGIHVMIYNYRGYGRSGGNPHPSTLQRDGEALVKYLREVEKAGRVGVHSESIGGVVACHLARMGDVHNISLVIADRTFGDLGGVASTIVGDWAKKAISFVRWQVDNVENFISAPASVYRVCTCDPNDEIIANSASLKVGIARRLIHLKSGLDPASSSSLPSSALADYLVGEFEPWMLDDAIYLKFGVACQSLVIYTKRISLSSRSPDVDKQIPIMVKLLLSIDGRCGSILSVAVHEFFFYAANNREDIALRRLMDWFQCYIVWSHVAPKLETLQRVYHVNDTTHYNIGGIQGICGKSAPCGMRQYLNVSSRFLNLHEDALQRSNLLDAFQTIHRTISKVYNHRKSRDESTDDEPVVSNMASELNFHLLPLTCGHNNHMNPTETSSIENHLKNAGWFDV